MDELKLEGFDLELTGFSLDEIDALAPEVIEPGLTDEDAVPEVQAEPVSKLGDVWVLGKHRVSGLPEPHNQVRLDLWQMTPTR